MKNTVKLSIHENYIEVIFRFYKQTCRSYVEYSLCGANVVELIKEPCSVATLKGLVESFNEDHRDVTVSYLEGFKGHFTFTYKLIDEYNILSFDVVESRYIHESRGGRSVNGGFNDKMFRDKIFMNLLTAASDKDVKKLNAVMSGLYSIGG